MTRPPPSPPAPAALPPAAVLLGRRVVGPDPGDGAIVVDFLAAPEFANRHGTVQGGLLAAMLDSAAGSTLIDSLPTGLTAVTTELTTRFVAPAPVGPLTARVRIVSREARDAVVEVELAAPDGGVVARGTARFRILARR